ncbi:uncharacterized protein LOC111714359 [Eurytemora carolleeae]|uniref:uncharacterized protein LOC111714359 n=1 Tax=Eurytemora carolleeae TaxID=1294199 RepID=UPI000C75D15A|nr:uncharacterized protein LOC111714359 [Eurytemora carolleeae]|eukprot:XP_023345219.1 uncharacterized protein LOC111714359 [Eurytemora affinis]
MATLEKKIKMLRFLKRFQYIIFFTVCAGILLVQIASCFAKYLEEPSYISSFIADQQRAEFPEITLCSEGGGYKSNILLENGFLSSSDYSATGNHTWHSTNTTVTPQELFESATFSAEDMIEKMLVRTVRKEEISR